MSHRERTNPRGHDRRPDNTVLLQEVRRVGRPARQDALRDDGEDHDACMYIEKVMSPDVTCISPEMLLWGPGSGGTIKEKERIMAPRRLGGEQGGAFLLRSAKGGSFLLQSYVLLRLAPRRRRDRSRVSDNRPRYERPTHAHQDRSPPRPPRVCIDLESHPSWC